MLHHPPQGFKVTSYSREPTAIERLFYHDVIRGLASRRVAIGLTQEELDQEIGVAEGQVAKWESFARLPGAFMFMCWSNRLGLILEIKTTEPVGHQPQANSA